MAKAKKSTIKKSKTLKNIKETIFRFLFDNIFQILRNTKIHWFLNGFLFLTLFVLKLNSYL